VGGESYEYDLAVSFAGEQRAYVEEFVLACKGLGLRVFYDRDMEVAYWGENFIFEFRKVYGGQVARFFVPFLSTDYLNRPYPMDEFAAAIEQEFRRGGTTYLLPIVVGDVAVPPELVNPAVGRLRADRHTPQELAAITARKLGLQSPPATPPVRLPRLAPRSFDAGAALRDVLGTVRRQLAAAVPVLDAYGYAGQVTVEDDAVGVQIHDAATAAVCGLDLWLDTSLGTERLAMSFAWPRSSRHGMNGWATAVWDSGRSAAAVEFTDLAAGGRVARLSAAEFFEVLWAKVVDFLESRAR
jgi:hypothetical protein